MKTISELNSNWWYRLIKVVYLIILLGAFVGYPIGIFFSYGPEYDNDKSYIKCGNGKQFILGTNGIFLNSSYLDSWDVEKAKSLCFDGTIKYEKKSSGDTFFDNILTPKVTFVSDVSGKYELISFYTDRNWFASVGFSLLSMIGVLLTFEIIRRIFYYVILGSIKPKK